MLSLDQTPFPALAHAQAQARAQAQGQAHTLAQAPIQALCCAVPFEMAHVWLFSFWVAAGSDAC